MTARLLAGLLFASWLGCSHAPPRPADTLRAFVAALRRGDDAAAYRLTTQAFRSRVSQDEWKRRLGSADDRKRLITQAERALAGAPARAEIAFSEDAAMAFVADPDGHCAAREGHRLHHGRRGRKTCAKGTPSPKDVAPLRR